MDTFVTLDVSLNETSVCVLNRARRRQGRFAPEMAGNSVRRARPAFAG
jgi:hypothetical protein